MQNLCKGKSSSYELPKLNTYFNTNYHPPKQLQIPLRNFNFKLKIINYVNSRDALQLIMGLHAEKPIVG